MKKLAVILLLFLLIFNYKITNAQCNIFSIQVNGQSVSTYDVCEGSPVTFTSTGSCSVLMNNDFNNQTIGAGWASNCNPQFNNPCDPSPDGTPYLWVGSSVTQPRRLATVAYSVSTACTICFDMDYATQGGSSPCEGPDLSSEGVHLQYSTNGGATWTDINYWNPNGGYDPYLTAWHNYCENIPINGSSVQFSWYQDVGSGSGYDHWGIDNVQITCPISTSVVWNTGATTNDLPTFNATLGSTGWYTVTYYDTVSGAFASDSIYLNVIAFPSADFTVTSPICVSDNSTITYTGGGASSLNYTWNFDGGNATPGTGQGPHSVSWTSPGTYNISLTVDDATCSSSDTEQVVVNPLPTATISGTTTVCGGSSVPLQVDLTGTAPWDIVYTDGTNTYPVNGITTSPYVFNVNPATPTTYSLISVSDASCTGTVSGSASVTMYTLPTATISGNPDICLGDSTQITVNLTGTAPWNITYTDGTNNYVDTAITGSPHTITVNPNTTTTYTLTGVSDANCIGTNISGSATVTVYPIPTADFILTPINCFGDNTNINYTGTASSAANYDWNFGGGNASPGQGYQGPQQVNFDNSGTFNISLTVTENGCVSPTYTQAVLNPPLLTSNITTTDLLCYYDINTGSAVVSANGGTIANDYTYLWSSSTVNNDSLTRLQEGIYSVTVQDDNGCQSVTNFTINRPDELVTTTPPSIYLCNGRSTIITATTTGGTPAYSYSWNGNLGGSTLIDDPREDSLYTVIVTDANGCTDTSKTMIYVSEPVHLELISNKDSVCPGQTVQITANISSPAGGPYQLSLLNGGIISTPFEVNVDTMQEIIATVTDGCGSEDIDTLKLNFYPAPVIDFSPNKYNGCQPLNVQFNQNTPYSQNESYAWNFGDNQQDNLSYEYNPKHLYKEAGVYDVSLTLTNEKGCKGTKEIPGLIKVYPKPDAKFIADPEKVSMIKPEVSFINLSSVTDTSYWNFMDGDTSNATNPLHYFKESGTYNVELIVTSNMGCRDTVTGKIIVEDPITFYAPTAFSPDYDGVNDEFKIYATGIKKDNFLLQIYNRWGEIIFESTDINKGWDGLTKNKKNICKQGAYTWVCSFIDVQNNENKRTGSVILLK